jgi:hypothetical protein
MKNAVMKWTVVADVFIHHTTAGPIPDSVYDLFVKDLKSKPYTKFLGSSTGAAEVTSLQRKSASEALRARNIPSAVITDERLVRGIVTAASWLGVNIKSFSWTEARDAIKHLGVAREHEDRVLDALTALRTGTEETKR